LACVFSAIAHFVAAKKKTATISWLLGSSTSSNNAMNSEHSTESTIGHSREYRKTPYCALLAHHTRACTANMPLYCHIAHAQRESAGFFRFLPFFLSLESFRNYLGDRN
jgi:hypothetical protein